MSYASETTVPIDRSKAEIERLLDKYGADQFVSGWELGRALIGFRCHDRYVRFTLLVPDRKDKRFTHRKRKGSSFEKPRPDHAAREAWDQEMRRRWRCLALVVKAKLEAVETGITTFEQEFMAHIVMPDGRTVGDHVTPKIAAAYKTGKMPKLLPAGPVEEA